MNRSEYVARRIVQTLQGRLDAATTDSREQELVTQLATVIETALNKYATAHGEEVKLDEHDVGERVRALLGDLRYSHDLPKPETGHDHLEHLLWEHIACATTGFPFPVVDADGNVVDSPCDRWTERRRNFR